MTSFQYNNQYNNNTQHNYDENIKNNPTNQWLVISPNNILLQGILLTGTFNLNNIHEHLVVKFLIKSYVNNKQIQFLQVFPQKGTVMRGQIKKIRVKFMKDFQYLLQKNNNFTIKVFMNLNTSYNKQYMQMNRFTGWNEIAQLPIEQYEVPILISSDYKQIKSNIREEVKFQSQFGKISQEMSSLHGEEKFQMPEPVISSKKNFVQTNEHNRYSEITPYQNIKSRVSAVGSEKKQTQKNLPLSNQKIVYFGMQPKISESRLKNSRQQIDMNRSRSFSHDSKRRIFESPSRRNEELRKTKVVAHPTNNKINDSNFNSYSSVSILKEIQSQSQMNQTSRKTKKHGDQNSQMISNQFNTITSLHMQSRNSRSIELIFLAILAGFFVALGSNLRRIMF